MKRKWRNVLWICAAIVPTIALAQAPSPTQPSPQPQPAQLPPQTNVPTGTPEGVARMRSQNSTGFPAPQTIEGQPIETRPPELAGDHPVFSGETRAPYHATAPYDVTTITDQLMQPWSLAFLPDGKMLVTEKPGALRIVDAQGTISQPLAGVPEVAAQGQVGLLDVALDPGFATNKRIFFTYSEARHPSGKRSREQQYCRGARASGRSWRRAGGCDGHFPRQAIAPTHARGE